jgi:hypothetical protein
MKMKVTSKESNKPTRIALAVVLALGMCLTQAAFAHGCRAESGIDPEKAMMMLTSRLGLTDQQTTAIEPILTDLGQRRQALREEAEALGPDGRRSMRESMQELTAYAEEQFAVYLSEEQMDQLSVMREERRANFRKRMHSDQE